jgi:hypothetical protein
MITELLRQLRLQSHLRKYKKLAIALPFHARAYRDMIPSNVDIRKGLT